MHDWVFCKFILIYNLYTTLKSIMIYMSIEQHKILSHNQKKMAQ